MTIAAVNDSFTYKSPRGDTERPADLVAALLLGANGTGVASSSNPVPVISHGKAFSAAGATLTRPANTTAYAAGDSISDNSTAGSVTALSITVADVADQPVAINEIVLATTDTGLAAGVPVEVELFNSDPTASSGVGAGDNAAYSQKQAGWVGRFQGTFNAFSDGGRAVCVPADGQGVLLTKPVSGGTTIWYQIKTLGGFTPSSNSTTIIPTVKGWQGRA